MPNPTLAEVEARVERVVKAMPTHVLHFALRAVYGRAAPNKKFEADLTTLLAEHRLRGEAMEALAEYVEHSRGCGVYGVIEGRAGQCDCGLRQALGASDER